MSTKTTAADAERVRTGQRNKADRFSIFGVALFLSLVVVGWQISIQTFAWAVGYNAALGDGLLRLPGPHVIYPPWAWFMWGVEWGTADGKLGMYVFAMFGGVAGSLIVALGAGYFYYYRRSLRTEVVEDLHGSARWAKDRDVEEMGLLGNRGVFVGAYEREDGSVVFLRYNGAAHLLTFAPTRSWKGVTRVLPTLLTYPHSVLNNDIKLENYSLTSGFRHKAGSLCARLEPTCMPYKSIDGVTEAFDAVCWNVLEEIRLWTEYDVMDAQNIAAVIADPDSKGMDDHWVSTSYELLSGIFLHMMYGEPQKSLAGCAIYLADPTFTDPEEIFNRMLRTEHDPTGHMGWVDSLGKPTKTHPVVAVAARAMLNKEEKERNSVLSTAKTRLALFMEPIVGRNTSQSDFRVDDLMNHHKPFSLYLGIPPSDKERLRPLMRLFITFAIRRLTAEMRFEDGRSAASYMHRLLGLIDELPSLRKLDVLQDALAYAAGYGITFDLIIQDLPQLKDAKDGYGENQQIVSGCHVRIGFTPNTLETARVLSEMTGQGTVNHQKVHYSGKRMAAMMDQMSVSIEQQKRPLMEPDEVMRMPPDQSLVYVAGYPAIKGRKIAYFAVPELQRRAELPAPGRISIGWLQKDARAGMRRRNWLMLSAERASDGGIWVAINVYEEFPAVRPVVKQKVLQTGELLTFDAVLCDNKGNEVRGALSEDVVMYDLKFTAPPAFDVREAFEVHLPLASIPADVQDFAQRGFFGALSVYERELREAVRKAMRNEDDELSPRFLRYGDNAVCQGTIYLVTEHCIAMRRDEDSFYLHRRELIDRELKEGESVLVRYRNGRGTVEAR